MKQVSVMAVVAVTCTLWGVAVPATAATVEVVATGVLTFRPRDVTITVGDSVHWTGLANGVHTVAESDDENSVSWNGGFHSPAAASEYTLSFHQVGLFHYICEPHVAADMRGTVTVEEPIIPTVSEWGLAAMTLLILYVGTIAISRRQVSRA